MYAGLDSSTDGVSKTAYSSEQGQSLTLTSSSRDPNQISCSVHILPDLQIRTNCNVKYCWIVNVPFLCWANCLEVRAKKAFQVELQPCAKGSSLITQAAPLGNNWILVKACTRIQMGLCHFKSSLFETCLC